MSLDDVYGQVSEIPGNPALPLENQPGIPHSKISCGVCAHFCPEDAIPLPESDRIVEIAPPLPEKKEIDSWVKGKL